MIGIRDILPACTQDATTAPVSARCAMKVLWHVYRHCGLAQRALAALRPYICPLQPIVRHVAPSARVLDVGCGNGLFLAALSSFRAVREGVGVDVNAAAVKAGNIMARECAFPIRLHRVSSLDDWPRAQFELVSMIDVIHHVPKMARRTFVQAALARVEKNGCFLYKDMCSKPLWRVAWNAFHDLVLARQLVHVEPLENIIAWAREVGFEPIKTDSYSGCFYGHELMVMRRRVGRASPSD